VFEIQIYKEGMNKLFILEMPISNSVRLPVITTEIVHGFYQTLKMHAGISL
jgi:hypothetical protein